MNMDTVVIHPPAAPLGLIEKVRVVLACVAAIVLLSTVGWMVAAPADSHQGVTLATHPGRATGVWAAVIALTVVAGWLGTVMAPRRLAEGGVFVAAVGLAGLALKGGSMQDVMDYMLAAPDAASRRWLAVQMAMDTVLWTGVLAATWVAVALARRMVWGDEELYNPVPAASRKSDTAKAQASRPTGWWALIITGLLAAFIIWATDARTPVATIARGQIIASVGGGFFLGAMAARYFTGQHRAHWYVLAVPAVALLAWLVSYLNSGMAWAPDPFRLLKQTPPHALARPLPIEYLAVGVAGALAGFWSGERVEHVHEPEKKA